MLTLDDVLIKISLGESINKILEELWNNGQKELYFLVYDLEN